VEWGQRLGLSGNSGTEPATLGEKSGAHLHFELIIQDAEGEKYLGQGLALEEVKALLERLFIE
jgi:murein DD-endopeptidase MepM/ murein hydrolase activator NlpD